MMRMSKRVLSKGVRGVVLLVAFAAAPAAAQSAMNAQEKANLQFWFDMVRVDNGLVQEHWDSAVKNPPAPTR